MKKLFLGLKIDSTYASLVFSDSLTDNLTQKLELRLLKKRNPELGELQPEMIEEIREEIIKVERATSSKVFKIYFCFPQDRIKKIRASYKKLIHPKHSLPLSLSCITSALKEAQLLNLDWDDFCLETYPLEFKVDGKIFRNPPLGIYGRRLEVDVLFYVCRREDFLNLEKVFQYLGKPYQEIVLSSLAEASSFREDSLGKGNFSLLNIGRNKVEFSYFRNFLLEDSFSFYKGGKFIDEQVSSQLNIPGELSEEIKLSYGSLAESDLEDPQPITIKKVTKYKEIKRSTLNSVIFASYKKILEELKEILERKDLLRKIDYLVILGGASRVKGFESLAEQVLSLSVYKPALYVSNLQDREDRFLASLGVLRFPFSKFNIKNKYKRKESLFSKIKNFLEEYF